MSVENHTIRETNSQLSWPKTLNRIKKIVMNNGVGEFRFHERYRRETSLARKRETAQYNIAQLNSVRFKQNRAGPIHLDTARHKK